MLGQFLLGSLRIFYIMLVTVQLVVNLYDRTNCPTSNLYVFIHSFYRLSNPSLPMYNIQIAKRAVKT